MITSELSSNALKEDMQKLKKDLKEKFDNLKETIVFTAKLHLSIMLWKKKTDLDCFTILMLLSKNTFIFIKMFLKMKSTISVRTLEMAQKLFNNFASHDDVLMLKLKFARRKDLARKRNEQVRRMFSQARPKILQT